MDTLKTILKYVVSFIVLLIIFFGSLTITSLIPSSNLKNNVIKTSEIYKEEGEKKIAKVFGKEETIFIFTDALMVNTAYSIDSEHPIESFVLARKNYIPGQTQVVHEDSQYNLGASKNYKDANENVFQAAELYGLMHGEDIVDSYEYARYWHGYLVFLRPLLAIMSIQGIRALNFIIICACIVALFFLIRKKCGFRAAVLFLLPLVMIDIFVLSLGLSDVYDMIIAMVASIVLLELIDVREDAGVMFFIFGCLTSFIDLFTIPLVTLCLPLTVFFLVKHRKFGIYEEKDLKQKFISEFGSFVVLCYSWALGYILTWAAKWFITEALFDKNIISSALEQVKYRSVSEKITYGLVLSRNFKFLGIGPIILLIITIAADIGISFYKKKDKKVLMEEIKKNMKERLINIIPFALISIIPFVWLFVVKQHSAIHAFFVNRILVIFLLGILMIVYELFSIKPTAEKGKMD